MQPEEEARSNQSEHSDIEDVVGLNYAPCLSRFFLTYLGSYLIPGILLMNYLNYFFLPYFIEVKDFISLFTEFWALIALITMPLVLIACYVLHLFFVALLTRIFWRHSEKKSPSKEGMIPRSAPSKTLDYYNMRSFMIKYPKNLFVKGMFPWLTNTMFNFIGTNKIGKHTTIEEQLCGDKFIEVGHNCYIGANSVLTTHLVEGVKGRIAYFKIRVGDNSTFTAKGCVAPGGNLGEHTYLLPFASAFKFSQIKGENFYFGLPLRKIFKKKILEYLKISLEDLEREKQLREKQKSLERKGVN